MRLAKRQGRLLALLGAGWIAAAASLPVTARAAESPVPGTDAALVPVTNMVRIAAGTFLRPKGRVTLTRDFWIGKFEVTQAEFLALMGRNPSHFTGDLQRPVEKVSQVDAIAYCTALTRREREAGRLPAGFLYRLPTEAEWEYACRAGISQHFSFGDDDKDMAAHGWTEENSEATTHPVGAKAPNPWGLYDMHGNVWEWCLDWFAEYPAGDQTDPVGPPAAKYKVFRGGSWNHAAKFARSSSRFVMAPASGIYFVGFRVVLGPVPPPAP